MSFKRVLLVKPSGRHGLSFTYDIIPTGLEYIAAYIEGAVDEVRIIDLEMESAPVQQSFSKHLSEFKPDLVGISMSSTEHREGLDLAKWAKDAGAMTILGGYHPTAIPDELLSHSQVDFVARGEGEITMLELVKAESAAGIDGLSYKDGGKAVHNKERAFIEELDSIPFPARHLRRYRYRLSLEPKREYDVITTSRGCWGRCSFCCEPSMSHSRQRYRSSKNVMDEILVISSFYGGKPLCIEITDPHFMGKPAFVEELCGLLGQHKLDIKLGAKVRPDSMAKYPDVVRKMIQAGIEGFEMGIESPHLRDLKGTSKGVKAEMHVEAVNNIRKWGGIPGGTFVIGLPEQTEEEILAFPSYAKKIGLLSSAFGIATPYPGTKFYEELDEHGLIFEDDWNRFDEMHSVFKTKHLSSAQIEELASICMAKFWTIDTFIEQERVRYIKRRRKPSLVEFISDRVEEIAFGAGAGYQLQEGNFSTHLKKVVEASADPGIKEYTKNVGVHNVLEMSRFLKLLGEQTIQFTVKDEGVPVTSWVIKSTKNEVEHIDVMRGAIRESTINFEIDLKDLNIEASKEPSKMDSMKLMAKILASNKGVRRQFNLARLLTAGSVEFLKHKAGKRQRKAHTAIN